MSAPETIPHAEFYVAGGTLRRDAPSYVVRAADERLYSCLIRGEICYALTPRQMGKSSLMVRTAGRLREQGVSVAVLDLTAFGQNLNAEQWYNGHLGRIGQQLELEDALDDYWNSHLHLGPFQRWAGAIRDVVLVHCAGRVVVFIDEIDAIRSLPFPTDEFFAGIREFFNRRTQDAELNRLTFCLLGVATPSDLIRDTRTTPFNIGVRVELSDFTADEAAPLAQGLCGDADLGTQLLRRILYWTGGHPYLTQRLCQAVSQEGAATPAVVDRICADLFLSHRARERDDNLLFVRERILRDQVDVAGLLLLYGKIRNGAKIRDEENNYLVTVLRLAGVVRVEHGDLRVRNRIYSEVFDQKWVRGNLPGAELKRQRTAYFSGVRIAALILIPLVLLGLYGAYREFQTNTTNATPPAPGTRKPPVFWSSFATQSVPMSTSGVLLILAGDPDIAVFVNDTQYGKTESGGTLRIPALPAGEYDIRLERVGYTGVTQRAQVTTDHETRLRFKLSPTSQVLIESEIQIESATPGERVSVDGKAAEMVDSNGALSIKVPPGTHEVRLERPGYISRIVQIQAMAGNNVVMDGKLDIDLESTALDAALRSKDPAKLQDFLDRYPKSKGASLVQARIEDLEWDKCRVSDDPMALQAFMEKYPNGQHIADARALSVKLQQEDSDWHDARSLNTINALQLFVQKYPQGRYVADAQRSISLFEDQAQILQLLRDYEDAFNNQDLSRLLLLWPKVPSYVQVALNSQFKSKKSGTLHASPKGIPDIQDGHAVLNVTIVRSTESARESKTVPFTFQKQKDHWEIERGDF